MMILDMPQFARWLFVLVAFWSTCAVWAEDHNASHHPFFWTLIALIAAIALGWEIIVIRKQPRKSED
jgi:hypothetical protein